MDGKSATASKVKARRWLITGVSSGLGRALLQAALACGDQVAGTIRDPALAEEIEALAPGRSFAVQLDLLDPAAAAPAVAAAAARLGGLDILVNNAGAGIFGPVEACGEADFRRMMEVNLFGPIRLTKAALPLLRAAKGAVINMSSMAGIMITPGTAPYTASKHAMEGFSQALAAELAPLGVKVLIVVPGGFRTAFWSSHAVTIREGMAEVYGPYPAGQVRALSSAHVGHELGDPKKLAAAVIATIASRDAPLHLVLGADAMEFVGAQLGQMQKDLDAWRAVGAGTAFR